MSGDNEASVPNAEEKSLAEQTESPIRKKCIKLFVTTAALASFVSGGGYELGGTTSFLFQKSQSNCFLDQESNLVFNLQAKKSEKFYDAMDDILELMAEDLYESK